MRHRLELTPQALDDAREAYAWYEQRSDGLGDEFLAEIERCFDVIRERPEMFERANKEYRRAIVRRFPYAIYYAVSDDLVVVHSIFHSAQNPRKWRRRLN
jgi:plasmid stabilization system protein ParE